MKKILTIMALALLFASSSALAAQWGMCKRLSQEYQAQYNAYHHNINKHWGDNFEKFMRRHALGLILCSDRSKSVFAPRIVVLGLINTTKDTNLLLKKDKFTWIDAQEWRVSSDIMPHVWLLEENMSYLDAMLSRK